MSTALKQPAGSSADEMAVSFARVLRGAGINVPIDSVITFVQALDVVSMTKRDDVYWAGRATLVHGPEDQQLYDRAFAVFWERRNATDTAEDGPPQKITLLLDDEDGPNKDDDAENNDDNNDDDNQTLQMRFTANESLRSKDFAQYTDEELHESLRLMHQLRLAGPPRQSLRLTHAKRSGSRHDLRRTVRASLAFGGEPARLHWRKPSERQRRLVGREGCVRVAEFERCVRERQVHRGALRVERDRMLGQRPDVRPRAYLQQRTQELREPIAVVLVEAHHHP